MRDITPHEFQELEEQGKKLKKFMALGDAKDIELDKLKQERDDYREALNKFREGWLYWPVKSESSIRKFDSRTIHEIEEKIEQS